MNCYLKWTYTLHSLIFYDYIGLYRTHKCILFVILALTWPVINFQSSTFSCFLENSFVHCRAQSFTSRGLAPTVLMTFTQDNAKTKTKQVSIVCLALVKNLEILKGQIYHNANKCLVGKCNRQPNIERGILLHKIQFFPRFLSSSFFPRLAFRSCEEKEAMARYC